MRPYLRLWSAAGLQGRHDDVPPRYVRGNLPDLLACHLRGLPVLELSDDSFEGPLLSTYRAGERIVEKYTLLESLGVGGMGEVWAARSDALDSKVAIKLIRGGSSSPTGQRRLLREARATARLAEPSIVRVFDFG